MTPSQIIWKRLKGNKLSIVALYIIILAVFITITGYLFIPDNSPDANEMNLTICIRKPLFNVAVIKLKKNIEAENKNFFSVMLSGKPSHYKLVAVDTFYFTDHKLLFREYDEGRNDAELHEIDLDTLTSGKSFPSHVKTHSRFLLKLRLRVLCF